MLSLMLFFCSHLKDTRMNVCDYENASSYCPFEERFCRTPQGDK